MKTLKITTIGTIISVLLAVSAAFIVGSSLFTMNQIKAAGTAWHEYENGPSRKIENLNTIYKALGFGGVLDQYKSYLLQKDRHQIIQFQVQYREIRVALDAYKAVGVDAREAKAMKDILGVINAYAAAIIKAEQMVKQGKPSDEIARTLVVDDAPAIKGINVLVEENNKGRQKSADAMNSAVARASTIATATSVIMTVDLIGLLAAMIWFSRWKLGKPLNEISVTMTHLARGELNVEVPAQNTKDEIGDMARTVQVFKDNMIQAKKLAQEQLDEAQRKEQRRAALEVSAGTFENSIGNVLGELSNMSSSLEETSSIMSETANEASSKACAITESAELASSNVQTVASAADELSSSITEITRQVSRSTEIATTAVTEVGNTNEKVQGLADAARKISEVVSLITDIADQTNLLALNATIEAARAGDAGKGFAVVASEVKNLANQTTRATEEITAQISGIQGATNEAVEAIGSIGDTINDMNEIVSAIAAAVEQQGSATQEIARNIDEASNRTSHMASDVTEVNSCVGETEQAAGQVQEAVKALGGQSVQLRSVVETFLHDIKAE